MKRLSAEEYKEARARIDAHAEWLRREGRNSYLPEELEAAGLVNVSNEVRSQVEVYEFVNRSDTDAQRRSYMGYWFEGDGVERPHRYIGTWMGDVLARVESSRLYEVPTFGRPSVRVTFRASGIDGRVYSGVYYKSSGDYVTMRALKNPPKG